MAVKGQRRCEKVRSHRSSLSTKTPAPAASSTFNLQLSSVRIRATICLDTFRFDNSTLPYPFLRQEGSLLRVNTISVETQFVCRRKQTQAHMLHVHSGRAGSP
jgi:hypothetical protein